MAVQSTEFGNSAAEQPSVSEPDKVELTDAERVAMEHLSEDVEGKSLTRIYEAPHPAIVRALGYSLGVGIGYAAGDAVSDAAGDATSAAADAAGDAADAVSDAVLSTPHVEPPEEAAAPANASVEDLLAIREQVSD